MADRWETMETVTEFIFLGSKSTVDDGCSHEIKRHLLLRRKTMTNLDNILKSGDYFANKDPSSQSYDFSSSHVRMWDLDYKDSWAPSLSLFTFMHWKRKWQPTPVFLPGKSHGWRRLVGYSPWGREDLDMTEGLQFQFHIPPPSSYICAQSCNPMDCSLPGSSVHGFFQTRIMEWIAISFSSVFAF